MPAPASTDEFVDLVRKSGVLEEKRLDSYLQQLRAKNALPDDAGKFAGLMVRDGFLTHFQAEQFMMGKWRRFTIGKYKVLERLGSGGMGSVYLCEHKFMRRRVAVKVLPAAKAEDPSSLERFYREARAAAALDHPNIVRAYDIDQDENLHFLVMEYVDGSSLQEIVKKFGQLNVLRACHYVRQSAIGLHHAHEAGLVHRDIKPGNLLVDRAGTLKVLDMGLARFFHDEEDILTKKYDESVLGTADYLAPEQALDSHGVDIRADIYSLGATFYFCLTGQPPFNEGTVAQKLIWHQTRAPKGIRQIRADVPEQLVQIIDKMMAKDKSKRFQTPAQVADALAPWTRQAIPPPPEGEMPRLSLAAMGGAMPETASGMGTPTPQPTAAMPRPVQPYATPAPRPAQPSAAPSPRPQPAPMARPQPQPARLPVAQPVAQQQPARAPVAQQQPARAPVAQQQPARAPMAQHAPARSAATPAPVATPVQPTRNTQPGNGVVNWGDVATGAPSPAARAANKTTTRGGPTAASSATAKFKKIIASIKQSPKMWMIIGGGILLFLILMIIIFSSGSSSSSKF